MAKVWEGMRFFTGVDLTGGPARLDAGIRGYYDALWDCRAIGELKVSPLEIAGIIKQYRFLEPRVGDGCTALVIGDTEHFSLAQLALVKAAGIRRKRCVFFSFEGALVWIEASNASLSEKPSIDVLHEKIDRIMSVRTRE